MVAFFNKKNVKILLKLLGRPKNTFDGMNFLKPKTIRKMVSNKNAFLISVGEENFKEIFNLRNVGKVKSKILRNVLKVLFFFKLNNFLAKIIIALEWYYPIVLVLKKRQI